MPSKRQKKGHVICLVALDYVQSKDSNKQTEKRKQVTFSKMAMQHKRQAPVTLDCAWLRLIALGYVQSKKGSKQTEKRK